MYSDGEGYVGLVQQTETGVHSDGEGYVGLVQQTDRNWCRQ